jgi:hypothetical protein
MPVKLINKYTTNVRLYKGGRKVNQISRISFSLAAVSPIPSSVEISTIVHMIYLSTDDLIDIKRRGAFRNTTNNSEKLVHHFPDIGTSTGPITESSAFTPRCRAHTTDCSHSQSAQATGTCIYQPYHTTPPPPPPHTLRYTNLVLRFPVFFGGGGF